MMLHETTDPAVDGAQEAKPGNVVPDLRPPEHLLSQE